MFPGKNLSNLFLTIEKGETSNILEEFEKNLAYMEKWYISISK